MSLLFLFVDVCPEGGWCDGRTLFPCPPGTYNPHNGSQSDKACLPCPLGYYCQNSGTVDYRPFVCPQGHYCPLGTKFPNQFPCPAGTYNPNVNQTSRSLACLPCTTGNYCVAGSIQPTLCPPGYYCPAGTGARTQFACHAGTYNDVFGLKNYTECKACPPGSYCPDGSLTEPTVTPIPCPAGTYNPNWNVGFLLNCIPCTAGYFCPQAGQVNATDYCYEGYYCPNGTIAGHQFPCPPGTYGDRAGLTLPDECLICPQGKICGWGTGINNNNTWTDCRPGHYCPLGELCVNDGWLHVEEKPQVTLWETAILPFQFVVHLLVNQKENSLLDHQSNEALLIAWPLHENASVEFFLYLLPSFDFLNFNHINKY